MSVTLTNLTAEVQARCNALTGSSLINDVIDAAIAAKKVERAGGTITRTTLDTQIQRFVTASGSGNLIEDLIALAASVEAKPATNKVYKTQLFTSSGSWVRPAGVDFVDVLLVGGGGGAGGTNDTGAGSTVYMMSGAGGGGQVIKKTVNVTSLTVGASTTVAIGAGGTGGANTGAAGAVGGDSTFGSLVTALGGGSGGGIAYSSGGANGTPRATSGGGITNISHGSYGVVLLGGLGGGAGSSADPGWYVQFASGVMNSMQGQTHLTSVTIPCGAGLNPNGNSSSGSYYTMASPVKPKAGTGLYGFGAGGGYHSSYCMVPGLDGAGGANSVNAAANSGGGGGGWGESGVRTGGNGGSGFCQISWWE